MAARRRHPVCRIIDRRDDYPPRFELQCGDGQTVVAPADGIVVGIGRSATDADIATGPGGPEAPVPGAPASQPNWAWTDTSTMGEHVIVDHGPRAGHGNVTTIHWGITVAPDLTIGSRVGPQSPLGTTNDDGIVSAQVWLTENVVSETANTDSATPIDSHEALLIASGLSSFMESPVSDTCSIDLAAPNDLPNAGRPYRSGTHRGVDLICGSTGHSAFAVLDGTVVAVVDDYVDSPVQPRLDVLTNAALAGGTPHWTLNLLYGNYVVIEHRDPDGREVITISAHLESVEPGIAVGTSVAAGDRLGEVGNRGTGPSAAGTTQNWDRSRHLHWEIFIDGTYLSRGLSTAETRLIYRALFCGNADVTGC